MSDVNQIIEKLRGTREADVLNQMKQAYFELSEQQKNWYEISGFTCPEGCGSCCHNFEPDLLDCEASYMAAWIIQNQPEVAEKIVEGTFPFENGKTCPFHDFENPYHCSIYEGRPFICRMFGGCGNKDKEGRVVWKPCKFYPADLLQKHEPALEHKQYNTQEVLQIFGVLPPVMSNLMEKAVSINPDNKETQVIRQILPGAIRKIMWLMSLQ
ncbi:MAG: YkgJ family cysteine cluster protein [Treponema sp.]|nr:YkgJ family cysteine cluster protein [Treponema sp.]